MAHNVQRIPAADLKRLFLKGVEVTATAAALNSAAGGGVTNPAAGVASGYKVARGVAAVTGTAAVATGLTSIVSVVATLKDDPALTGLFVSAAFTTGGTATLKVWKPTASGDATPIASTTATNVSWIAVGT